MENLKLNPTASLRPSTESSRGLTRQKLLLRCQKVLFSAYRADQYADAEGFMLSLGAVLEQFSDEVVVYVTDPRTGIQRHSKWPPTISEMVDACEEHRDFLVRVQKPRAQASDREVEAPDGSFAQVFVPQDHARYPRLVEWSTTAQRKYWKFGKSSNRAGIWVAYGAWDDNQDFMREAQRGA